MLQMQTMFIYREFLYADIQRIKRIGAVGAVFEQVLFRLVQLHN